MELNVARQIVRRTKGSHNGPATRLMSPGDLGQVLKPFVFLDVARDGPACILIGRHGGATLRAAEQRPNEIRNRLQNEGRPL
jgi:hypothetical protein